jgi:DNA-binding CsgD family transcriptional regulator
MRKQSKVLRVKVGLGRAPLVRSTPSGDGLLSEAAWAAIARSLRLSGRELEITRGVFDNLTDGALAANLRISEHTVHTHLHRLFGKLRVTTRVQVVVRVMQELLLLTLSEVCDLPPICRHHANGCCPMADPDQA